MALCVSLAVFALELHHPDDLGARAAGSATPILRWLVVLAVEKHLGSQCWVQEVCRNRSRAIRD